MSGERDLDRLLAALDPWLDPQTYVFATTPPGSMPGAMPGDLDPLMQFQEAAGTTLILRQERAERAGLNFIFPCRRITLRIHSALDAVGLIAAVSTALAKAGVSANPVSGFFHDHIFVAQNDADTAIKVIRALTDQHR